MITFHGIVNEVRAEALLRDGRDDDSPCRQCGDVGWTIEVNEDGEEYIDPCFICYVKHQELSEVA